MTGPYAIVRGSTLIRRYRSMKEAIHDCQASGKPGEGLRVVYAPSEEAGPLCWEPVWHWPEDLACTGDRLRCPCADCWEFEAEENREASDEYAREMADLNWRG